MTSLNLDTLVLLWKAGHDSTTARYPVTGFEPLPWSCPGCSHPYDVHGPLGCNTPTMLCTCREKETRR